MFSANKPVRLAVARSKELHEALEKVCDDYIKSWFGREHKEVAGIVKEELQDLAKAYANETEEFKITWIQFLVAGLKGYLQEKNSAQFLKALSVVCDAYYQELNTECLKTSLAMYPVKAFQEYLQLQTQACKWIQQGRIQEFKERYDFYRKNSPQMPSISATNVQRR